MKNRKLLLIVSLVLALTMSLGGTLAYLTDTDEAVNVMTLGNVKIEQLENGKEEYGFENGQPLYPAYYTAEKYEEATDVVGKLDKTVTVKNEGSSEAYIRTVIAFEAGDLSKEDFDTFIHATFATTHEWIPGVANIAGVNYYLACVTYPEKVAAKAETAASLVDVAMDKTATNEVVANFGDTYEILVVSQACQTVNMPENAKEALNIAFGALTNEAHPWSDWKGASDEPAGNIIASKADLLALAGRNIEGTYTLMANIDMNGEELKTIGVTYNKNLVFNGNGYTISNAKLVTGAQNGMTNIGLFYVEAGATLTVSDLNVKNVTAEGTTEFSTGVAAVVGYANQKSKVVLNNVDVVNANIKNEYSNAAMLVGYTVSKVDLTDCDVTGTAVGEKPEKQGAYIGTANTADCVVTITNCTNGTNLNDIGRVLGASAPEAAVAAANADDLVAALEGGKNVRLLNDVKIDSASQSNGYGATGIKVNGQTIDGNGKTLDVKGAGGTWDSAISTTGGTIKNMTVSGAMRGIFMPGASADVLIENVVFKNVIYTFNSDAGNKNYGVTVKNSTLNGWTSFSEAHKFVEFIDCNFGEGSGYAFCRPYNAATFTNCVFAKGFEFDTMSAAAGVLTFEKCYYGDTLITAENANSLADGDVTFFYNGLNGAVIK